MLLALISTQIVLRRIYDEMAYDVGDAGDFSDRVTRDLTHLFGKDNAANVDIAVMGFDLEIHNVQTRACKHGLDGGADGQVLHRLKRLGRWPVLRSLRYFGDHL